MIDKRRAQASLEFISDYVWVVIVIVVCLAVLSYMGFLNPGNYLPDKAEIQSVTVKDMKVDSDSVTLIVSNTVGKPMKSFRIGILACNDYGGAYSDVVDINEGESKVIKVNNCDTGTSGYSKFRSNVEVSYASQSYGSPVFSHEAEGFIRSTVVPVKYKWYNITNSSLGMPFANTSAQVVVNGYGEYIVHAPDGAGKYYSYVPLKNIASNATFYNYYPYISSNKIPFQYYYYNVNGSDIDLYFKTSDGLVPMTEMQNTYSTASIMCRTSGKCHVLSVNITNNITVVYLNGNISTKIPGLSGITSPATVIDYKGDYYLKFTNGTGYTYLVKLLDDRAILISNPFIFSTYTLVYDTSYQKPSDFTYIYGTDLGGLKDVHFVSDSTSTPIANLQDWTGTLSTVRNYMCISGSSLPYPCYYLDSDQAIPLTAIGNATSFSFGFQPIVTTTTDYNPNDDIYIIATTSSNGSVYYVEGATATPVPGLQNQSSTGIRIDGNGDFYAYAKDDPPKLGLYYLYKGTATKVLSSFDTFKWLYSGLYSQDVAFLHVWNSSKSCYFRLNKADMVTPIIGLQNVSTSTKMYIDALGDTYIDYREPSQVGLYFLTDQYKFMPLDGLQNYDAMERSFGSYGFNVVAKCKDSKVSLYKISGSASFLLGDFPFEWTCVASSFGPSIYAIDEKSAFMTFLFWPFPTYWYYFYYIEKT